uniref:DNA topoisomerase n=1 Tax=Globodera rostochiensis TaxID=31243 RepID=A0A914GU42_GLORO
MRLSGVSYINCRLPFSSSAICNLTKQAETVGVRQKFVAKEAQILPMNGSTNRRVLCVAEKNDVAKNIAKLLSKAQARTENGVSKYNKNYTFEALFQGISQSFVFTSVSGHLMNYDFHESHKQWNENRISELFEAQIILNVDSGMRDIETNLRAHTLLIWTDCDREGEHIGDQVVKVCRKENSHIIVRRARFSEITEQAIARALNNLLSINQNLVDAVDCRMELDLRIGAAFSRLQTLHIKKNFYQFFQDDRKSVLSYGSCQFPTLGFVVERYKENREFVSEEFWKLSGKDGNTNVGFLWEREGLSTQLFDREAVLAIYESCNAVIHSARVNELEKLGSRYLKMNVKRVVESAEKLYQRGFISYPRTETNCYSAEYDLDTIVTRLTQNNEWGHFARDEVQRRGGPRPRNGRKTDEAHPPIHPVKNANRSEMANMDEWKVYELICRYFLATVSRDASGRETKIKAKVNEEIFTATGLIIDDRGYLQVYPYDKWSDKELPVYQNGQSLPNFQIKMPNGFTQPSSLLTEADLIALMDNKGIGTDATHAEHIERIKFRKYVVLNCSSRFEPTKVGLALIDGYDKMGHRHKLSKPILRALLEEDLLLICEGKKSKQTVLREHLAMYKELFRYTEMNKHVLGESLCAVHQLNNHGLTR